MDFKSNLQSDFVTSFADTVQIKKVGSFAFFLFGQPLYCQINEYPICNLYGIAISSVDSAQLLFSAPKSLVAPLGRARLFRRLSHIPHPACHAMCQHHYVTHSHKSDRRLRPFIQYFWLNVTETLGLALVHDQTGDNDLAARPAGAIANSVWAITT
jgi:hypothetical protein